MAKTDLEIKRTGDLWNSSFRDFARLQAGFENLIRDLIVSRPEAATMDFSPTCEISEDKKSFLMKFDMPGVKKEEVKVELERDSLAVKAERNEEKSSDDKRVHYSEVCYGSYERHFALPPNIDAGKIEATFENGTLKVTLPKTESTPPKKINVN